MATSFSIDPVTNSGAADLNNLERLGAYFTSQIHDINNQISVLSNSEMILRMSGMEVSPEVSRFLDGLFNSIHRLSETCNQFNAARKFYPIEIASIPLPEAVAIIIRSAESCPGWTAQVEKVEAAHVFLNPSWIPTIVQQLIAGLSSEGGNLTISVGKLPARHYQFSLRSSRGTEDRLALLIHLVGNGISQEKSGKRDNEFKTELELVRLMGAALSMSLSNDQEDILLGFPIQRV